MPGRISRSVGLAAAATVPFVPIYAASAGAQPAPENAFLSADGRIIDCGTGEKVNVHRLFAAETLAMPASDPADEIRRALADAGFDEDVTAASSYDVTAHEGASSLVDAKGRLRTDVAGAVDDYQPHEVVVTEIQLASGPVVAAWHITRTGARVDSLSFCASTIDTGGQDR